MRARLAALALAAALGAGCGAGNAPGVPDSTPVSDAASGDAGQCAAIISFNPAMPTAPATVRATAAVSGAAGVLSYQWFVTYNGSDVPYAQASPDFSQIDITAASSGVYNVRVVITGATLPCPDGTAQLTVQSPGANIADFRLRVWPPPALAPTQEQVLEVHGGGDADHAITLDPGIALAGTITNGTTGIPAYVRFMPVATPDAYVETFAAANGAFSVRVLGQPHQVLIVPAVPGLAPRVVAWSPGTTTLAVSAGTTVTGTVVDAGGAALAGATVQLASGGVPSSLATTAADGSFSIHEAFAAGASVTVDVVPPPGRGLPRLDATAAFDLAQPLRVRYATIATCDLAGTKIARAGTAIPGAQVTVVGTLAASAGTVTAGTAASATGSVRIVTTADGTGHLPGTLAPKAPLSAVIAVAAGDLAVAALDLTAGPPATIAAPAPVNAGGLVVDPAAAALAGVRVQASGTGPLAAAGAGAVETASSSTGAYALALAAGGTYDVRYADPEGRAAPLVVTGTSPGALPATAQLAPALHVSGMVTISGNPNPAVGAAIQVLCLSCTGVDAARPLAETAVDATSHYRIAVPDPGTM